MFSESKTISKSSGVLQRTLLAQAQGMVALWGLLPGEGLAPQSSLGYKHIGGFHFILPPA